ncbi:murein L,D-transpeptidase [Ferruginibacter sp. HRS2-29]|uniref:L,D-transpeptidase family protein n=1 Tax=Ferruginibacter sp. HRS2-29 TaxID=2487334 RepID=UPI0020CC5337|nr:L,D-transpeptidase family protein [Ferruginibacter sp. HRS2-29]MCP9750733.1 hypothetical protein [Ferruginibacter sp. HRS2-29]MCP9752254.1 hypothetical protein [Ferruginibacter sp. HRS2-29]
MNLTKTYCCLLAAFSILLFSCNTKRTEKERQLVSDPASMDGFVSKNIRLLLENAEANKGKMDDSLQLRFLPVLKYYYRQNDYTPVWSSSEKWKQPADSLVAYLKEAALDGLFAEDYQFGKINNFKKMMDADSVNRTDAVAWAKAELLFTDAFMHLLQDLKQGRLQPDSLAWKNKEVLYKTYFTPEMEKIRNGASFAAVTTALQPKNKGYSLLKSGIRKFVDSMDNKVYTYIEYPYKNAQDSLVFIKKIQKRMTESGITSSTGQFDSAALSNTIKHYQAKKGLKADGKISTALVRIMNMTDKERFRRIALTLDRYKQLPEKMPEKYIWVNLPAYYLKLYEGDSVALESKIICGKPGTPTPLLTSAITDMMVYPTWTIPTSIISKETLPALKRNPGYLARKGFYLLDNKGERVDPYSVNWAKYSKGIPYRVQQGSGDDNALGVIKFNFDNPYSVYLHDTNQRYLFGNSMRSLSHGCVRVQEWQKLAFYLVRNDSILSKQPDSLKYNSDSIVSWIAAKERHKIPVKNRLPLFIRYFGCELVNGSIRFYDDIYGDDRALAQKYFAGK